MRFCTGSHVTTLLVFSALYVLDKCSCNEIVSSDVSQPVPGLDDSVVTSILQIVDDKFDTLSERVTSLERAVNNLQYYDMRQFRVVNRHLHALDTILQGVHSQMGQLDIQSNGIKISIDLLSKDTKSLQTMNSGMFEALEQNIVLVSQDINSKLSGLQESIDALASSPSGDAEPLLEPEVFTLPPTHAPLICNCSEGIDRLEERIDKLTSTIQTTKLKTAEVKCSANLKSNNDHKILMKALSDINSNVGQHVDFNRHTGELIERVVGAAEQLVIDQKEFRKDIEQIMRDSNETKCPIGEVNHATSSPEDDNNVIQSLVQPPTSEPTAPLVCNFPSDILQEISQFSKNGTQLVELLTHLASLSRISLKTSVIQLHGEIGKLQKLNDYQQDDAGPQEHTSNPGLLNGLAEYSLERVSNQSEAVLHMMEAVAANTGWIPHIFHNLQFVESQVKEILMLIKYMVSDKYQKVTPTARATEHTTTGQESDEIVSDFDPFPSTTSLPTQSVPLTRQHSNDSIFDDQMIRFMYHTSYKLDRLLPAFTKLLGEPEPFVALVGGEKDHEGRVEFYNKGQWGTLCTKRMGHIEATYICRYLGYLGGIAAGKGYFGPGSGPFFDLNVTCLQERWCTAVYRILDTRSCDHDEDFAVICDHMIRLTPVDDNSAIRHSGRLDIHHAGSWIPLCNQGWSQNETQVACRQLGYHRGDVINNITATSGKISTTWMTNVTCKGSEGRLDACAHAYSIDDDCRPLAIECRH